MKCHFLVMCLSLAAQNSLQEDKKDRYEYWHSPPIHSAAIQDSSFVTKILTNAKKLAKANKLSINPPLKLQLAQVLAYLVPGITGLGVSSATLFCKRIARKMGARHP